MVPIVHGDRAAERGGQPATLASGVIDSWPEYQGICSVRH